MKVEFLEEPELEFYNGGTHIDVRFGIMQHGPLDRGTPLAPSDIRVGIVGTEKTLEGLTAWLDSCRGGIPAKRSKRPRLFPRFPGFASETCFGASVVLHGRWQAIVPQREIAALVAEAEPGRTVFEAVDLFVEHARRLTDTGGPMVVICAPPEELLAALESGIRGRSDPVDAPIDEGGDRDETPQYPPAFHDLLKARAMELAVPIQMIRPETYGMSASRPGRLGRATGRTRLVQDEATRAWNLHTALYYKAGGIPWRLVRDPSDLTSCFVGISFYRSTDGNRVLTSMAQVFNERGEGVIVKGATATFQKEDRAPHLSAEDACRLLVGAIAAYRVEHGTSPARVAIHKTSATNDEEKRGFEAAAAEERIAVIDVVSVSRSSARLFRQGIYPPLRGTLLHLSDTAAAIYLRGSVNFFETYPGPYVPRPFEFKIELGSATPRALAEEVFALSKLNWNNTQFDGGDPITVRAARKVGDILKHVAQDGAIQSRYRFYM